MFHNSRLNTCEITDQLKKFETKISGVCKDKHHTFFSYSQVLKNVYLGGLVYCAEPLLN